MKFSGVIAALGVVSFVNGSVALGQGTVAGHVETARRSAGAEWSQAVEYFCVEGAATPNSADHPLLEPTKLFDNLYAIGRTSTVVYAITTSEGIILIDSGYADQVESVLLPGMAALDLDPNDIRYVIVAHGHGDHYGGSTYLQEHYGARVVLSAEDWDLLEQPAAAGRTPVPPPRRDIEAVEGEPIALGDVAVTPVLVPGHTAGSLGLIFPVRDNGNEHMAALFGGTILTSGRISDQGLAQYIRSLGHFGDVAAEMGVDVEIQNHPLFDGMAAKLERLETRRPGSPHPFVLPTDGYQRFLDVMASCMRAELARRAAR
jgi:metallo-beta-lactamase class B